MCDCRLCQRGRRKDAFFEKYQLDLPDQEWLQNIFNHLYKIEGDLDYKNCVLHGDWPTSVEQLERALKIAKKKREDTNETQEKA